MQKEYNTSEERALIRKKILEISTSWPAQVELFSARFSSVQYYQEIKINILTLRKLLRNYIAHTEELTNTVLIYQSMKDKIAKCDFTAPHQQTLTEEERIAEVHRVINGTVKVYDQIVELNKRLHNFYCDICCCFSKLTFIAKELLHNNQQNTRNGIYKRVLTKFSDRIQQANNKVTKQKKINTSEELHQCIQKLHQLYNKLFAKTSGIPALHDIILFANHTLSDNFLAYMEKNAIVLDVSRSRLHSADDPIASSELLSPFDPDRILNLTNNAHPERKQAIKFFYLAMLWKFIASVQSAPNIKEKHMQLYNAVSMLDINMIPQMRNLVFMRNSEISQLAIAIREVLNNEFVDHEKAINTHRSGIQIHSPRYFAAKRSSESTDRVRCCGKLKNR